MECLLESWQPKNKSARKLESKKIKNMGFEYNKNHLIFVYIKIFHNLYKKENKFEYAYKKIFV